MSSSTIATVGPSTPGRRAVFRRQADLEFRRDRRMRWLNVYFAVLAVALAAVLLGRTADRSPYDWLGIGAGIVFAPLFTYLALVVFGRPFCLVEVDDRAIRFGGRGTRLLDRQVRWGTDRLGLTVQIVSGPVAEAVEPTGRRIGAWFHGFLQPRFALSAEAAELILDAARSHGASIQQQSYHYGPAYHVDIHRIQLPSAPRSG